mmetsp:Transcript_33474/g.99610  ORF Transcript_33474/g.99610 Transcript_33474/m.99610 type:complete len:386 (+) Transcript_33474:87-1244(+)
MFFVPYGDAADDGYRSLVDRESRALRGRAKPEPPRDAALRREASAPGRGRRQQRPLRCSSLLEVDALQRPLGLAAGEVLEVVVVRRELDQPIALDVGHHPDVVLGGEHKLVVHAPLGLVLQHGGRVQRDHLVVLDGEVVAGALEVRHLHEEAGEQALPDVGVVLLRVEVWRLELETEAVHHAHQLRADGVSRLHRARVEEVVVAPRGGLLVVLPRVVYVEQSQVVAVDVLEARLGLVGRLGRLAGPHERVGCVEHRDDGEDLVRARELRRVEEHLCQLRVERELGHHRAELGERALVVEGAEVVEQLERAHERLGRGRVHKVKVHQVLDAELLELQHDRAEVRTQDLGVRLLHQLRLVRNLRVEAETLARPGAAGAAGALVRRRL